MMSAWLPLKHWTVNVSRSRMLCLRLLLLTTSRAPVVSMQHLPGVVLFRAMKETASCPIWRVMERHPPPPSPHPPSSSSSSSSLIFPSISVAIAITYNFLNWFEQFHSTIGLLFAEWQLPLRVRLVVPGADVQQADAEVREPRTQLKDGKTYWEGQDSGDAY